MLANLAKSRGNGGGVVEFILGVVATRDQPKIDTLDGIEKNGVV